MLSMQAPSESASGFPPEEEVDVNPAQQPSLWNGWDGLAMMSLGFFAPALLITVISIVCFERIMRMVFKHPVETLIQCAFVLLIPFANYFVWKAIRYNEIRNPLRLGLLNGAAIATSFASSAIIFASIVFNYPPAYGLLGAVAFLSGSSGVYLAAQLRNCASTRQSRTNRLIFSTLGVLLSLTGLAACEAKGTVIRVAETMALSDVPKERDIGLDLLRNLGCEQDLRMQCADDRTAGIPGVFLRISPQRERELYFAVFGKPYGNSLTESVYSMSDEYLSKHVVGAPIKGLNLLRSAITGYVNPETLTSTVNLTFVFKNGTFDQQEARAELALPPGAVISDLTLWAQGEPHRAMFGATDRIQSSSSGTGGYNWVNVGQADPALITDLGRGRVLLKCSPIPAQGEMKVQMTVTEKLKPITLTQASLSLPKFVGANFSLSGDHNLRLHAPAEMSTDAKDFRKQRAADGGYLLIGSLKEGDLNAGPKSVVVNRPPTFGPFFAEDRRSTARGYIKETLKQVATKAPEHLVVVVDNSESMNTHSKELIRLLREIPENVKTSLVLPTAGQQMEPVPLKDGIELIAKTKFVGGKDNLQAVIKAAEAAGETKHGAVLWIHGPQPSFNEEMYIMAPYIERPNFFELALDDRWTDTNEFFKNHREIGPFSPVARNGSMIDDLRMFLSKWKTGGTEYVVELVRVDERPNCKIVDLKQTDEFVRLCARDECQAMLRQNNLTEAAELGTSARIVTQVTGAVVLGRTLHTAVASASDPSRSAWLQGVENHVIGPEQYQQHMQTEAPTLQGATNGSIGTDDSGATVIAGINTAGTVRVNNLANLEALLNIVALGGELLSILVGAILMIPGMLGTSLENPVKMGPRTRAIAGGALIFFGFTLPGMINWLVASARDANLFS